MAKFLLLTHIYPPAVDGGSRVIAKMGEYLEKHGHEVLVVTSNCTSTDDYSKLKPTTISHPQKIISLPVITIFHRPFKLLSRLLPNFKTFSKGPIFAYIPIFRIITYRPDYILAGPLPTTIVLYARLIRFLAKTLFNYSPKLVINASFHPNDPDFQSSILLNTLKSAEYIWTLTDYETNYFQNNLSISQDKLLKLGNGVDKSFLLRTQILTHSTSNLLFIGSFSAHKNVETLIEAFKLLPSNYKLTLAGQKTLYFPVIQSLIKKLDSNISHRIKIIYSFPDTDLSKIIDSADILISPSLQESFGLILIEAMARGKAVIAANIPASIELINKSKSGLIFDSLKPIDLRDKILNLSQKPKLSETLGKNGLKFVSKYYIWDRIGDKLCQKLGI
ncbi:MAG: glycosyltransferase family 4 protein [Candidatus Shapirobacteria bacterium]